MTDVAAELPVGYPTWWEADVVLRDGSVAHFRPIKPSDGPLIEDFHAKQSDESIYFRFFAPLKRLSPKDLHRFTHVDYVDRAALVATVRDVIIGVGRYDRVSPTSAEVAFNISDSFQGRGIGSVMLEHLAAIAQEKGITRFVAEVLPQNRKMLSVFSEAGYVVSRRFEDGVVSVSFDITETEQSVAVRTAREHRAEAKSMASILTPSSIAVIGASTRSDSLGHLIMSNILRFGYTGQVAAVNAKATEILGVGSYPKVGEVPFEVDLAIIAVPARNVPSVVDQCADKGVKSLLIISSGFAESGTAEAAARQAEIVRLAHGAGMRVLGPNSFGVVNLDPEVRLNASIAPRLPEAGGLGLFAQSGALGIAILDSAARRRLGISVFASAGNRADVSGNDFLQHWIDDERTAVVGLYLESVGNPRKFTRIGRQVASRKPVIVTTRGSGTGRTPGHQVRESSVGRGALDAIFRQAGVIRAENTHQLFDIAQLVCGQPLPAGPRVAIVANSDALCSLTAEAVRSWGLPVTHGPVAVRTEATAAEFRAALDAAAGDPEVDSVLTVFIPPLAIPDEDVAAAVRAAASEHSKPVLGSLLGMRRGDDDLRYTDRGGVARTVPVYSMPEDAARALAKVTGYAQWLADDHGELVAPLGVAKRTAQEFVDGVLEATPEGRDLTGDEAATLLGTYGIALWPTRTAPTVEDAVARAEELGYPVVLKSTAERVRHQQSITSIRVDLGTEPELRAAYESIAEHLRPEEQDSIVVQRMAALGVACVVRSTEDPSFGPVVSFSIAGPPTELLDDIGHRVPPMTDKDVQALISCIKAAPLLQGHRGAEPVDRVALEDLVARVSVLAEDHPEIASLVLNPVLAHAGGVDVLGAEIRVAPAPVRTDSSRRALTQGS